MTRVFFFLVLSIACLVAPSLADEKSEELVRKYRETLKDASPGELYVIMGEELYRKPRGPSNVSLERCDFGLGPGVLKGAYAQLPCYFADTNKVEDLESRLISCMRELQGFGDDAFPRHTRGDPRIADFEQLIVDPRMVGFRKIIADAAIKARVACVKAVLLRADQVFE